MKKVSKTASRARNAGTLANAAGLTLIMGLVNVALAADVKVTVQNPATSVAGIAITSTPAGTVPHQGQKQFQDGNVKALIENSGGTTNTGAGASTNVTGGNLLATAKGNQSDQTTIDPALVTVADGFSIATGQVTKLTHESGGIVVNATINNSPLAEKTFTAGSDATVSGNTALATAMANQSSATAKPIFVNGFSAPISSGSASIDITSPSPSDHSAETKANGGIINLQHTHTTGSNAGTGAWISNSGVSVDATGSGSSVNAGDTITITGNEIGARYGANDTDNLYAGNAVVHDGSTAISNLQDNSTRPAFSSPILIPATASINNSGINVDAEGNSVDGVVSVTGNELAARSSGNTAQNVLALEAVALQGNGVAPSVAIAIDTSGSNATVNASADNATLAIVSGQRNNGRLESEISDSHVAVTSSGGSGAITISRNTSIAEVGANDVNNEMAIQAGSIMGGGTAIVNAQLNRSSVLLATNSTDVAIDFDNSSNTGTVSDLTITDNSIGTRARGNVASNTLASSASGSQNTAGHILANAQVSVLGQINATTTSDIGVTTHGVIGGTVDVLGNTVSSSAQANQAESVLTLNAEAALSVSDEVSLANIQVSSSPITAATTGNVLVSADPGSIPFLWFTLPVASVMDADANVLDNRILATATASSAQNTLVAASTSSLDAGSGMALSNEQTSTSTISASSEGSIGVQAIQPSLLGNAISGDATVASNVIRAAAMGNVAENNLNMQSGTSLTTGSSTLNSNQISDGDITATTTTGTIGIQAAGAALVSNLIAGDATVSNNTLASTALANLATNVMDVSAGTSIVADGALSLVNTQTSSGDVQATTDGSIGIQARQSVIANLITGDAIVSGNTMSAVGAQNVAENTLQVVGNTAVGGTVQLENEQTAGGETTVSVKSTELLGIQAQGPALARILGDAVVTGNTLASRAWGNDASNTLSVGSNLQNNADVELSNTQTNNGIVSATTVLNAGMGIYTSGMMGGGSTPVVSQNAMLASAYGNSAVNVLNAGSGTAAMAAALSSSSTQTNTAAISASVNRPGSGPGVGIASVGSMGSGAAIAGNHITASAYGNVSNSSLNASSLYGMGLASASMLTSQSNTADVSATVSNMGMGIASGGTASGSTTISNNTVSATAVGNAAVSRIVVGN